MSSPMMARWRTRAPHIAWILAIIALMIAAYIHMRIAPDPSPRHYGIIPAEDHYRLVESYTHPTAPSTTDDDPAQAPHMYTVDTPDALPICLHLPHHLCYANDALFGASIPITMEGYDSLIDGTDLVPLWILYQPDGQTDSAYIKIPTIHHMYRINGPNLPRIGVLPYIEAHDLPLYVLNR